MDREFFDIEALLEEAPRSEQAVVQLILQSARIHLQAMEISNGTRFNRGEVVMSDSAESLRAIGLLLGTTFNVSSFAIASSVEAATIRLEGWPDGPTDANSFISARLVEGLYEARRKDLASELFELMVKIPEDQQDVLAHFLEQDSAIN